MSDLDETVVWRTCSQFNLTKGTRNCYLFSKVKMLTVRKPAVRSTQLGGWLLFILPHWRLINLHHGGWVTAFQQYASKCASVRAYLCTRTSICVRMWAKDMFSPAMIQCQGRQIKSCLKASPVRPVTWRDNAVNTMSSCHQTPLACRQTRSSARKWTSETLGNVNVQKWLAV